MDNFQLQTQIWLQSKPGAGSDSQASSNLESRLLDWGRLRLQIQNIASLTASVLCRHSEYEIQLHTETLAYSNNSEPFTAGRASQASSAEEDREYCNEIQFQHELRGKLENMTLNNMCVSVCVCVYAFLCVSTLVKETERVCICA